MKYGSKSWRDYGIDNGKRSYTVQNIFVNIYKKNVLEIN